LPRGASLPTPDLPVPVQLPPRPDDVVRQKQLDSMKRRAGALLVLAAGIYVAARLADGLHPAVDFLRAAAEAALIGGLADWFAVTALFRHPLGIPIPHTAILPARKERLGRTLGAFIQNHFLSREVLSKRLEAMHLAERAARWMGQPENSRLIAQQVAVGLARVAETLPEEEMRLHLHNAAVGRLRAMQAAPLLGNLLSLLRAGNRHQDLLSEVVRLAGLTVSENREMIRARVRAESPWWVPGIVDEKLYRKIVSAIDSMLREIGSDRDHPLRAKFDEALEGFVARLQYSPEVTARAEALKEKLLDDPVVQEFTSWLWDSLRRTALQQAERLDESASGALERGISAFGTSLVGNADVLAQVDAFVKELVLAAAEQYRGEVAELIAHTVAGWDPDVTSRRIELAIGRDLQFIRINGTLVGALVGVAMHALSYFWK
jgi:uncharacterized membrane-anchored protein YjiN (DUF445 family)